MLLVLIFVVLLGLFLFDMATDPRPRCFLWLFLGLVAFTVSVHTLSTTSTKRTLLSQVQIKEGAILKWDEKATGFRSVLTAPLENKQYYEFKTNSGATVKIEQDAVENLMASEIATQKSIK